MVTKTEDASEAVGNNTNGTFAYERCVSSYTNNSNRFLIPNRTFDRQYASFYIARLQSSTNVLHENARSKWGLDVPIKRLCDVCGDEKVIVIGTIFKHLELHPSILKEISEEHHLIPQPVTEEFTKDDDYLVLEDDLQRVVLSGNIDPHVHVTGINVAVMGFTEECGKFLVESVCYTSVPAPIPRPLVEEDMCILLVSGFGLGDPEVLLPLQLLVDYINGMIGEDQDQERSSHISRVIIAGNSIAKCAKEFSSKAKFLTRKTKASTVDGVKCLDNIISQLVPNVDVDLMPGEFDPTNHLMPQQPLHPCMFPKSSAYSTFHSVTNPYDATIAGVKFLGSSGQNVRDVKTYSRIENFADAMERTLDWGHMSPTAPDTLNCYPFFDQDPFIIPESPHVYFAGNMPKLEIRQYGDKSHPVMVLCIPKFQDTFTAVLLNLRNLQPTPIVIPGVMN